MPEYNENQQTKIYSLIPAGTLRAYKNEVAYILANWNTRLAKVATFDIDDLGYIQYHCQVAYDRPNQPPQNSATAAEYINNYLEDRNNLLIKLIEEERVQKELRNLLPTKFMKLQSIVPHRLDDKNSIQYWTATYYFSLPYNKDNQAIMPDYSIEFDFTATIIGIRYNARIFKEAVYTPWQLPLNTTIEEIAAAQPSNQNSGKAYAYPVQWVAQNDMILPYFYNLSDKLQNVLFPAVKEAQIILKSFFREAAAHGQKLGFYKTLDEEGNCHFTIKVYIVNSSRIKDAKIIINYAESIKLFIESAFTKMFEAETESGLAILDKNGKQKMIICSATFTYEIKDIKQVNKKSDFVFHFINTKTKFDFGTFETHKIAGKARLNEPIKNWINIALSSSKDETYQKFQLSNAYVNHTALHELLHAVGLQHPWEENIEQPIYLAANNAKAILSEWAENSDDPTRDDFRNKDKEAESIIKRNIMTTFAILEEYFEIKRDEMPIDWQSGSYDFDGTEILPSQLAKIINNPKIIEP